MDAIVKQRAPYGSRPRWDACTNCGVEKTGRERSYARCRSCSHTRSKFSESGLYACRNCAVEKPTDEFVKNGFVSDGRETICKECKNAGRIGEYQRMTTDQRQNHKARVMRNRYAKYGLTDDLVQSLYEQQEGCCAICATAYDAPGTGELGRKSSETLHVDHDHTTGRIRGLLCLNCNVGLGRFSDSLGLLVKAAAYIERS